MSETQEVVMSEPERETVAAFVQRLGVTMQVKWVEDNPYMKKDTPADWDWNRTASHWQVTFHRTGDQRRKLTTFFSQGSAHTKPPTAEDVLDSLALDASSIENAKDFEDWCRDLGYDKLDYNQWRAVERTYKLCVRQAVRLRAFLGADDYRTLLENVERL